MNIKNQRTGSGVLRGRKRLSRLAFLMGGLAIAVMALNSCSFFGFLDTIEIQIDGHAVSSYTFDTSSGIPVDATVTIVNKGLFPLTLGGSAAFSVTGTNAGDFSVSGISGDTIEPGSSVSFTLTFDTVMYNTLRSAKVTITPTGGAPAVSFSVSGFYSVVS
jgi:hypothetical protein